jgi:hypothetical protein
MKKREEEKTHTCGNRNMRESEDDTMKSFGDVRIGTQAGRKSSKQLGEK